MPPPRPLLRENGSLHVAICCTSEAIRSAQNLGTEVKAPMDSPTPKESPFPLPQPTFLRNGWLVDARGQIFARSLGARELPDQAYVPGMSADDPRTAVVSFYEGPPSLSVPYSIEPYHRGRAYYYHRRIKVVFVPSWAQTPLPPAVEGMARFWQEPYPEDGFPKGARCYYHFFVHPTPPPILSPLLLHVEPRTVEGWTVDRDGFVSIEPMGPNEITPGDRETNRAGFNPPQSHPSLDIGGMKIDGPLQTPCPLFQTLCGPREASILPGQRRMWPWSAPPIIPIWFPWRNPSAPKIPPAAPLAPLPLITAPLTLLRRLPETFEAGYSLRDAKDTSGPEPRPSYHQGTQYRGSSYRPEKEERQEHLHGFHRPERDERSRSSYGFERDDRAGSSYRPMYRDRLPQALPGTPPIDRGAGTLLPLALAGARLIGRKTRSVRPTGRHTGRIELPGPDPTRDCPRVGIEIVEEALPAVGKAVGALEMKQQVGRRIHEPFPVRQELSSHTRDAGARLLERNRGDAAGQYHPKWANNNPSCFKDFKEEVPLLNPNGRAPNSALLQKLLRNPKSSVQRLVEQLPCRIMAVNSGGLPIPEFYQLNLSPYAQLDYSLSLSIPVQFQQARAHLPFVLRPRPTTPLYTNASPEYLERIVGPRSPLEASYLKGFQYLKRLDALGAIAQSPFKDEMNRGHLKFEEWCSEVDGLEGKTYLSLALVRLATHMALDTIAYLGGLESPVFSPDETLMGAIFGPSLEPQAPEPGTPDNGMRWNAVLMERLGVPCWGIMPRVGPQRLDFDAGGRPDADPLKEANFQKGMRVISQDQQPLQVVVYSQKRPCSPPSSPPVGPREFSDDLKAVIIRALDSEMPDAYTIEESSAKLKGLLGSKVWSGRWYEDGSHMERRGRVWYQTRDIPLHLGAHNSVSDSLIEVPLGYFHPELRFPLHMGQAPKVMTSAISPNKPSVLQGIEPNLWYRLTASPYPTHMIARDLAERYRPQGVLAFKGSLVLVKEWGIRQKDSQKRDAVLQRLRESDPKVDARTVDTDPHNWRSDYQHFFDEGYIRQLFADPRPIKDIEALLELAPPSSRPINTREAAKTVAMDMERARQALLLQMFEAGRYPPLFLHELTQAPCPENFSEGDHLCLKCLSLFLLLLAEFSRVAFRIPLYASQRGPYVRLMQHIVLCIQRAFEAKSVLCGKASEVELGRSFNQGTHDESVGAEFVQYAPKDCRFFIVLDPNLESPEYAPSKAALEADAKRVEAVIARVVEQSKNKGSAPGKEKDS
ncbi:hypothetical protein BS47DRAFT_1401107 [Hydnum rufescens UP504]|uniref:Uncharacterized protein n=1 Tax=Hydnum rufescens UP504 TaxID=1448309 RepID=A0A9P6AFE0_9AGAM|nr:hypothetical protein BS47DRAFT_1401107 [Hydnum rufescens UP504]